MLKEKIKNDIQKVILDVDINIFTNDNKHFNAILISDFFKDKSLLDRQKLVYDIISSYIINKQVHAFSFKTYTNDEWFEENNS